MTPLQKILVIGAGAGVADRIAAMFPEPTPERVKTVADQARLEMAENKRRLKAAKRLKEK